MACIYHIFLLLSSIWNLSETTLESIKTGPLYNVQVIVGGRAELPCDVHTQDTSDRVLLVLWYKDGVGSSIYTYDSRKSSRSSSRDWSDSRTVGGRAFFDLKTTPSALVIERIKPQDEGLYRCRVDFKKSPTRNARTNLNVIIPPKDPPIIYENGRQVNMMIGPYDEGSSLSLTCEVAGGKPSPQLTWWLENQLIDRTFERPRKGWVRNELYISALSRKHLHSSLSCQASNTNHSTPKQTLITIEMNFKPISVDFLGSRESLTAGKSYELKCQSVGARPPALITWWLGGQQLLNTTFKTTNSGNITLSTLYFKPRDDDGGKKLTCRAESPVVKHKPLTDEWNLEIHYTPILELSLGLSLSKNNIKEGDDVYFECNVRARPKVYKILWYHKGIPVQHNVSAGVIISNQTLVIQKVKREQTGLYTCVASNIEGDGESNALILKVQYVPVCADRQPLIYGAARYERVTVVCQLDAVPDNVTFHWRFNNSGDVVDISKDHITTNGLESSLSYKAKTELDYGTLLCWGSNKLGRQKEPCSFKVIPAGPPDNPKNCSVTNTSASVVHVKCTPGYDGGLGQTFVAEAHDEKTGEVRINVTVTVPDFQLTTLEPGSFFKIIIYAFNAKGESKRTILNAYTLKDVAEKRTAQVRPPPEKNAWPITPLLAVCVGVIGCLLLIVLVAIVVIRVHKDKRRPKPKPVQMPMHTPLNDFKETDELNPDIIPDKDTDYDVKALITPEEGGFPTKNISLNIASYSNTTPYPPQTYGTLPKNQKSRNQLHCQAGDLMYAELAFARNQYTNRGSHPHTNPTVYAQIDHMCPPHSELGGCSANPLSYVSPAVVTSSYSSRVLPPSLQTVPTQGKSVKSSMCSGPMEVHKSLLPPNFKSIRKGYEGPIPPPAVLEDDSVLCESPLLSDHKESEV